MLWNSSFACSSSSLIMRSINCSNFLYEEIYNLRKLKIILALGKLAFDNCIKFYKKSYKINQKFIFKHGKKFILPDGKIIFSCYHPSPRNVNTGLLNKTKISISNDDTRHYLNGIYLHLTESQNRTYLTGVATDSHRLSSSSIEIDKGKTFNPDQDLHPYL